MSVERRSKRAFLAVTLLTVLAVTAVFVVYATLLQSFTGGLVTIKPTGGSMQYATSIGGSWGATLDQDAGGAWYSRIDGLTGSEFNQVKITWTLQKSDDGSSGWATTQTQYTWMQLTASNTTIYASSGNGTTTGAYNWGAYTSTPGYYRVNSQIDTVP